MTPAHPVLIAGAGVAALEALLALDHLAGERVQVDLLAAATDFVYPPLRVLEPFGHEEREHSLPLVSILRDLGAGHVRDDLAAVDPQRRVVRGASGDEYRYGSLVVAIGARAEEAIPGALTFSGPAGVAAYRGLLLELAAGRVARLTFALPAGTTWSLPLYELALLTATWLFENGVTPPRIAVVTPEQTPLAAFGALAGVSVAEALDRHGIDLHVGAAASAADGDELLLDDGRTIAAGVTVALPRLAGRHLPGLPSDDGGFIPVDEYGRVAGVDGVYAAGDAAHWPVKQGGLAAQEADAVASALASRLGAPVRPAPFRAVLRGMLLEGWDPLFLRSDNRPGRQSSLARSTPLWWPPAKVAGRYLAPYLAARGVEVPTAPVG